MKLVVEHLRIGLMETPDYEALRQMFRSWEMPSALDHPWTSKPARGELGRGDARFVADEFHGTMGKP